MTFSKLIFSALLGASLLSFVVHTSAYAGNSANKGGERRADAAPAVYRKMLDGNPTDANIWEDYGRALDRENQSQNAVTAFSQAIALGNKHYSVYYGRGMSYSHLGKFEDAIADMTTAAKIGTSNRDVEAQLYCDRADAELSSKHFSSAADDYTRYMTLISVPDWARYTHRARAYAGCGKVPQAIQDMTTFVQAQKLRPKQRLGGYEYRASLYTNLKEYGKAISDLSSAIAMDPDKSVLYRERAKVYELAGKKDLADKDSVKAKQIDAKLYGD